MLFNKRPGFAGSLFFSLFLHALALPAADLFAVPGSPGKKDAGPQQVRVTLTLQKTAAVEIRESQPPDLRKPPKKPAAALPTAGKQGPPEPVVETGLSVAVEREKPEPGNNTGERLVDSATDTPTDAVTETTPTSTPTADTSGSGETPESHGSTAEITPPAAVIHNSPVYPRAARENNWEGSVLLDALILPDGAVGELLVERSSGYELLDTAALAAVKDWSYRPALKENVPVACRIKISIHFLLEE